MSLFSFLSTRLPPQLLRAPSSVLLPSALAAATTGAAQATPSVSLFSTVAGMGNRSSSIVDRHHAPRPRSGHITKEVEGLEYPPLKATVVFQHLSKDPFDLVYGKEKDGSLVHSISGYLTGPNQLVGEGSFGKVFKAWNIKTGSYAAVKRIELEGLSPRDEARQHREPQLTNLVRHPNGVNLYETIASPKALYLVMQFSRRGPLHKHVDELEVIGKHMEEDEIWKFIHQGSSVLSFAHNRAGVVHRDVKPANIVLDYYKNFRVCDWGGGKQLERPSQILYEAVGSKEWLSPEVAAMLPESGDVEAARTGYDGMKADVYGLGAVAYYCATGYPPYAGLTEDDTLNNNLANEEIRFDLMGSRYSPDLVDAICSMLKRNPARRPEMATIVSLSGKYHGRNDELLQ